ncbi:MAG TPA: lipopolysaccharide biosynthesis protein [Moheibacter sp.]|nr:lipopolysaccharide biosynthesis protein [Moheibacter sp.]
MSLRKQAVSGMIWTFSQQFGTQLISFVVGIILARLLPPSDFGTIAMFMVVIAIASSIIDGGMASSLIRTSEVDDRDLSTVFWFNIGASLVMYALIYLLAPWIAEFYEVEILQPLIRVYALVIIINSFVTVQSTRFIRDMDFKTQFKIRLPSLVIGGITGVVLALNGFGVWALVFYPIVQSIISTLQFWFYSKWRPSFVFDKEKYKYHFNYGYKLTLSDLLNTVFKNIYTVVIGKLFTPVQLGYYNRADTLKQMPVSNLSAALNSVTFPLFAKIQDNDGKLKEVYRKLMKLVIFIIAPVLCLMVVTAEPLIRFLLTEKWLPAVPYFQVLAIGGILYPIHSYNLNVLKVKGRSDLFLKLEIWKKVLIVATLLITYRFGIIGIVWGQVLNSVVAFFINTYYTGKIIHYGSWEQIKDLMPVMIVSAMIGTFIYSVDFYFFTAWQDFNRLIVLSMLFAGLYLSVIYLFKFKEITYIQELIKK